MVFLGHAEKLINFSLLIHVISFLKIINFLTASSPAHVKTQCKQVGVGDVVG